MNNFYKMGIYVLGLVIFLAGCSGTDAGKKEPKDTLRLIAPSDLTTLDSSLAVEAGAFEVMNATQEGLYRLDKDDKAEPAIAKVILKNQITVGHGHSIYEKMLNGQMENQSQHMILFTLGEEL